MRTPRLHALPVRPHRATMGVVAMGALVVLVAATPVRGEWRTFREQLTGAVVEGLFESSGGDLWVAGDNGATRYDGIDWQRWNVGGFRVHAAVVDRGGRLWLGVYGEGVRSFDGGGWRLHTTADGLAGLGVRELLEDRDGGIWAATETGVSRWDGSRWTTWRSRDGLADDYVDAILEDRDGAVWFGTRGGVSRFTSGLFRNWRAPALPSDDVRALHEDSAGVIWAGTSAGPARLDGVVWRPVPVNGEAVGVQAVVQDAWGSMWFGTDAGVWRWDGLEWLRFTTAEGLGHDRVLALHVDARGWLWAGTSDGLSRFDGVLWRNLQAVPPGTDPRVVSSWRDGRGRLWFGTGDGVARLDSLGWTRFGTSDGLVHGRVNAIRHDADGAIWFGTAAGVSRFDGTTWTSFTASQGLAHDDVRGILVGRNGVLWFGTASGVSRYASGSWTSVSSPDGIENDAVRDILEDRSGNFWFAREHGASRWDGQTWRTFTMAGDALPSDDVRCLAEDAGGGIWIGTGAGASRWDGSGWVHFRDADGLAGTAVVSIRPDQWGNLWFASPGNGGAARFDGESWLQVRPAAQGGSNNVLTLLPERGGRVWFGTSAGLSLFEPDRLPPRTRVLSGVPPVVPSPILTLHAILGYEEDPGRAEYSHRLDGGPWSAWAGTTSITLPGLSDGERSFEVRARDPWANVDPRPAQVRFEVDATPPSPVVASPVYGAVVRDSIAVLGTAADPRFLRYDVEIAPAGTGAWMRLRSSTTPVVQGRLAGWNTRLLPSGEAARDGEYLIRLSVEDSLRLVGRIAVPVIVDNTLPRAEVTSPVRILVAEGGDVYATDGRVHLYFPPRAFRAEAIVTITPWSDEALEQISFGQAILGFDVAWGELVLEKPGTLVLGFGTMQAGRTLALFYRRDGSNWRRQGGTADAGQLSAPLEGPGSYVLALAGAPAEAGAALSQLRATPRVFSPSGAFASGRVAISFVLGRSVPVTVKVYNRAGRLAREVLAGEPLQAGANLVHWDGRDRKGEYVLEGLYLVTVESSGETQVQTVAVVR